MKITALLVMKCNPDGLDPVILAIASDVSHFGYFQRSSVKEFIVFVGRTVAKRTPQDQRQSIQHQEYKVHAYNRNGLCAVGFMDDHYPVRSAFSLLYQVIDEYQKSFGDSWKSVQADRTQSWPYLNEALIKFQDPAEADKLMKIQRELDETKIILHKTIDSVLARGERLDSLVDKSSDLSAASQGSNISVSDCGSSDPDLKQEMEKHFMDLLNEELKLQDEVGEVQTQHMNITLDVAKRVASQYQNEADKCIAATETCEQAREHATAMLIQERKLTLLWEQRASQMT